MNEENFDVSKLFERIEDLETKIKKLSWIIQFHKLDKIESKYCKIFPKKDECPYFTIDEFNGNALKVSELSALNDNLHEIKLPKDTQEFEKSKKRMRYYSALYHGRDQTYYELYQLNANTFDSGIKKLGEALTEQEAIKWISDGESYECVSADQTGTGEAIYLQNRHVVKKTRRITNPNLLSSQLDILREDFVKFTDKWPQVDDFPIYKYYAKDKYFLWVSNLSELKTTYDPENSDGEIYWAKIFIGD